MTRFTYGDGPLGQWWLTDLETAQRERPSPYAFAGWGLPNSVADGPGVPTVPAGGTPAVPEHDPSPGDTGGVWPLPPPLRLPDEP